MDTGLNDMANFKQIDNKTASQLLDFVNRRNLGKSVTVEGVEYTLDYISHNTSAFWQSRGLSIYFRTGRNVVRISDHWSSTRDNDKSRKLNCGRIGGKIWNMLNRNNDYVWFSGMGGGRFPHKMFAGICGLTTLNKECDHWHSA